MIQPSLNDAGGWDERHGRGVLGQQSVSAGNPIGACAEERHSDERERKTNPVQARDQDVQRQDDDDASEKVNWRDRDEGSIPFTRSILRNTQQINFVEH